MLTSKRAIVALMVFVFVFGVSVTVFAVERNLAGIKLGSPAETVLKKYGNPTRVTTPQPVAAANANPAAGGQLQSQQTGGVMLPGMAGSAMNQMGQTYQGYANEALGGGSGSLPGLPGLPMPGGSAPGTPGTQPNQPAAEQTVTWTYDLQDGTTLEFSISESGRVIQITVGGDQPFALSKTSKGIKLGSYYKDVIFKYGYPEKQQTVGGRFLMAKYTDKHRCLFIFLEKKLVGITVAFNQDDE